MLGTLGLAAALGFSIGKGVKGIANTLKTGEKNINQVLKPKKTSKTKIGTKVPTVKTSEAKSTTGNENLRQQILKNEFGTTGLPPLRTPRQYSVPSISKKKIVEATRKPLVYNKESIMKDFGLR